MEASPLDSLLARGEHYAEFAMRQMGHIVPALFAQAATGPLVYFPQNLADQAAKNDFASTARLICVGYEATAAVMVFEAWAKFAAPGEKLDQNEPPSEAFDRKEVVILLGESLETRRYKVLPIIRTDAGGFFGFGEPPEPGTDDFKGRFARLLPEHPPTEQERAAAQALLARRGIQFGEKAGNG